MFFKIGFRQNIQMFEYLLKAHSMSETIFDKWEPFKNDEKCFLLHLKRSFRFQVI